MVLSEIRSLLEKRPKLHPEAVKSINMNYITDVEEWFTNFKKDVEKVLKADQEKLKPLMAHLQPENRPNLDAVEYEYADYFEDLKTEVREYFEELDKRKTSPENYVCLSKEDMEQAKKMQDEFMRTHVCVPRKKLEEFEHAPHKLWEYIGELLQPSTTSNVESVYKITPRGNEVLETLKTRAEKLKSSAARTQKESQDNEGSK